MNYKYRLCQIVLSIAVLFFCPAVHACQAWVQGKAYSVNDKVLYQGTSYVAIAANPGYVPSTGTWYWKKAEAACAQTIDTGSSCPAWVQDRNYIVNNKVTYEGQGYIAIADNPGYIPSTSKWYWKQNATACSNTGTNGSEGGSCPSWMMNQQYRVNDKVAYQGKVYIAIADNPGYQPSTSTWYWKEGTSGCAGSGNVSGDSGSGTNLTSSPLDQNFLRTLLQIANAASANKNNDKVHDALIDHLVDNEFAGQQDMFRAVKGNGNPEGNTLYTLLDGNLYIGRENSQTTEINAYKTRTFEAQDHTLFNAIPNYTNRQAAASFFVRDFVQVRRGVNGGSSPLIVENLLINDLLSSENNGFVSRFDQYISQINAMRANQYQFPMFSGVAHRDAIQLIPVNRYERYAGKILQNVTIRNNIIYSDADVQGVFASDGAFKQLTIANNYITTNGKHTISIGGMLSGTISGNKNIGGNVLQNSKITLYPMRIGGGANIMIVGFTNRVERSHPNYYEYEPIAGIVAESDIRRCGVRNTPNATYYDRVNMNQFWAEYNRSGYQGHIASQMRELMQKLVSGGNARQITDRESLFKAGSDNCK